MRAKSPSFLLSTLLLIFWAGPNSATAQPESEDQRVDDTQSITKRKTGNAHDEPDNANPATPRAGRDAPGFGLNDRRERRHILHNTLSGSVGGFHVVDAGSGADRTVRVALSFGGFSTRRWLEDERHGNVSGALAVSWSPAKYAEIYGASSVWRNSNLSVDRDYFQALGDWTLGAKGFYPVLPWLILGGDASIRVPLNTVLRPRRVGQAISSGLRVNLTFDLRELEGRPNRVPLIIRLNAAYGFERSSWLVSVLEQERYDALPVDGDDPRRPLDEEDRHLISRIERFGLQIDQMDRVPLGLGFEAPIPLRNGTMFISPIAEWLLDIPIDRGRYECRTVGENLDPCLANVGFAGYRQRAVFGLRVMPPLRGLSLFAAVEVGLTGVNNHVQELWAQPPYRVLGGISYAWDPKWEALSLKR
jgi:OmpA-OmpF porin, OOP family